MKFKQMFALLLLPLMLLTACATSYQAKGFNGGYTDRMLSPSAAEITFKGNGMTDPVVAYRYAMKRAAEVTLNNGYEFFEVVNKKNLLTTESAYSQSTGYIQASLPTSIVTIRFVKNKTATAYDALKVSSQVLSQ